MATLQVLVEVSCVQGEEMAVCNFPHTLASETVGPLYPFGHGTSIELYSASPHSTFTQIG